MITCFFTVFQNPFKRTQFCQDPFKVATACLTAFCLILLMILVATSVYRGILLLSHLLCYECVYLQVGLDIKTQFQIRFDLIQFWLTRIPFFLFFFSIFSYDAHSAYIWNKFSLNCYCYNLYKETYNLILYKNINLKTTLFSCYLSSRHNQITKNEINKFCIKTVFFLFQSFSKCHILFNMLLAISL